MIGIVKPTCIPARVRKNTRSPGRKSLIDPHVQQLAGGDPLHRQVKAILQRAPGETRAVDAALFSTAPFIGVPAVCI